MNTPTSNAALDSRLEADDPPCPEDSFATPEAYDALVHAWDLLKLVIARFWAPVQLASLPAIAQWRIFDMLDLLRPIELMLRRLIFIEARALAATLPAPRVGKARPPRVRKPLSFLEVQARAADPDCPETWPVRFGGLPLSRPGRPDCHGRYPPSEFAEKIAPRDHGRMRNPRPLAVRLEAVIRVAANPLPWIARLAARMRRRGVPDIARLAKSQRIRVPSALPTLNALAGFIGLPRQSPDSS